MAYHIPVLLLLVMSLISLSKPTPTPPLNQDLEVAMEEMRRANYFSFVMLINMSTLHQIRENVTFLMPSDRILSRNGISGNSISNFLLRHSIPLPLLFDYLQHFPTSSILPTLKENFTLRISRSGRRSFFLNNVKITTPNICTAGSSIRCHGIDGVLREDNSTFPPFPTCASTDGSNSTSTTTPTPWSGGGSLNTTPAATAPPPMDVNVGSGSYRRLTCRGLFGFVTCYMMVFVVGWNM